MSLVNSVGSTTYLNSNGRVSISQPIVLPDPSIPDYSTRVSISEEAIALNNGGNFTPSPNIDNVNLYSERAIEGQRQALGVVRDFEQQATAESRILFEQNTDFNLQETQSVDNQRIENDFEELATEARNDAQRILEDAQREINVASDDFETSDNRTSTQNIDTSSNQASVEASETQSTYQPPVDSALNRAPLEGYSGTNTQTRVDFMV